MFQKIIRLCFYALFILVPLIFLSATSELFEFNKIIVTYILTTLIATSWLARMIAEKRWIFKKTVLDWPLVIFLGINLISLVSSIDMHTSWFGYYSRWNGGLFSLASYALLYWAFVSNMDAKATLSTIKIALGTSIIVCLWGVAEHFGADAGVWVQDVQTRVFSTLGQPNWLAAYICALIFVPISMTISKSEKFVLGKITWVQVFQIGGFILATATLLFTKSRSGILAFGLAYIFYWIILILKDRSYCKWATFFSIILAIPIIAFPNPIKDALPIKLNFFVYTTSKNSPPKTIVNTSGNTSLEVGGTESGEIRKIVWTGAIRIWRGSTKNFFLGTGPDTFGMAYYQYRPIEHNQTSEWELLYNKAHNEFLNYLATTGLLGLLAYLLVLGVMAKIFIKSSKQNLVLALFAGWVTISITNFWGFSVVIVQLLLFLLPAIAITLSVEETSTKSIKIDNEQKLIIGLLAILPAAILLYFIGRYWLADTYLAASQKDTKYFQATQQAQYLEQSYLDATNAYKLNSREPVIASEVSNSAAYLALAIAQQSTDSARQLAQISLNSADQAIQTSPYHPNYYKSKARSLILLSDIDPQYLVEAAKTLQLAMLISPTDPRLPYNLGIVDKYLNDLTNAKAMFEKALKLKPDFADPQKQLEDLASASGKMSGK